jgi:hypothetical protein
MKNKNFRKLKYVSGDPQNAGFCTIYPTAWRPTDPRPKFFSLASLAVLHLLFQNSLLLLSVESPVELSVLTIPVGASHYCVN